MRPHPCLRIAAVEASLAEIIKDHSFIKRLPARLIQRLIIYPKREWVEVCHCTMDYLAHRLLSDVF